MPSDQTEPCEQAEEENLSASATAATVARNGCLLHTWARIGAATRGEEEKGGQCMVSEGVQGYLKKKIILTKYW